MKAYAFELILSKNIKLELSKNKRSEMIMVLQNVDRKSVSVV